VVRISSGGFGAALHFSVASSTSFITSGVDVGDDVVADAELFQPLAIDLDRIALFPSLQFAFGRYFAGSAREWPLWR
jgi:hypothetical protein